MDCGDGQSLGYGTTSLGRLDLKANLNLICVWSVAGKGERVSVRVELLNEAGIALLNLRMCGKRPVNFRGFHFPVTRLQLVCKSVLLAGIQPD